MQVLRTELFHNLFRNRHRLPQFGVAEDNTDPTDEHFGGVEGLDQGQAIVHLMTTRHDRRIRIDPDYCRGWKAVAAPTGDKQRSRQYDYQSNGEYQAYPFCEWHGARSLSEQDKGT